MFEDSRKEKITTRAIREGSKPWDSDRSMASPEARIEAVWMLTRALYGLAQIFNK